MTACLRSGIRLENCTGQSLGTILQDDEFEDESEDESGDKISNDDDSEEWVSESDVEEPEWGQRISPLGRQQSYDGTETLVGRMPGDELRA